MFYNIECPNPAYNRIVKSGLSQKIVDKKKIIADILSADLSGDQIKNIFNKAKNIVSSGDQNINGFEIYKNIFDLDLAIKNPQKNNIGLFRDRIRDLLIKYPSLIGEIILGNELLEYKKFGFPSRLDLEKAIMSFCIGEDQLISFPGKESWIWRNGKYKNSIDLSDMGDLQVVQKDVSGKDGRREFDTIKIGVPVDSFGACQNWSDFLISVLKYAESIGKANIPEIVNWEEIKKELGEVGTNTSECLDENSMSSSRFNDTIIHQPIVSSKNLKSNMMPILVFDIGDYVVPYVKNRKLIYLRQNKDWQKLFVQNKILDKFFEGEKFHPIVEFDENDLPEILKGIYKYYARNKTDFYIIMKCFLDWTKK